MGESLTQQRRVTDEAFRSVKVCREGRITAMKISSWSDGTSQESTG